MSDIDDVDIEGGEAPGADRSAKKASGISALLPNILKFAAIGLGALIFIVTVVVITVNIINKNGKAQTSALDPNGPYEGKRPEYAYYTLIGSVTVRTKDIKNYSATVEMIIGYDLNDNAAQTELIGRQYELRDFIRNYFTGKFAEELAPENEIRLKSDIKEKLNTRFLDKAKVRIILFDKLDIMEMP
jgi:flagellar FliL protein